jgi:LEA14-like dessication related protein
MKTLCRFAMPLVLAALGSGCKAFFDVVGKPEIVKVRPRIADIDLDSVNVAFDVDVSNPYVFPLKTPRFRYGLDIEGGEFLREENASQVSVPARGVGTITLPVRLRYANLADTFRKLKDAKQFSYRVHGALILSGLGKSVDLPLSHSGTLPVLRPPKFSDIQVSFPSLSATRASVLVKADMTNPNIFALGLQELGYALTLGDTSVGNLKASTTETIDADDSGPITLQGEISAAGALLRLLRTRSLGTPTLRPVGLIDTPYGKVKLKKKGNATGE